MLNTCNCYLTAYLHSKTQCVEHDEKEHEILKVAGGHEVPHAVLMRVLRDVAFEWSCFQCVLHTLTLVRGETARKDDCENPQNTMHGHHKPDSVYTIKVELKEKSFCQIYTILWIK